MTKHTTCWFLALFAFLVSIGFRLALVVFGKGTERKYGRHKPPRSYHSHVPRFSGPATALACASPWCLGAGAMGMGLFINAGINWHDVVLWLLVLAPVVAAGALEDYSHKIKAFWRLLASVSTAALGSALLGLSVQSLGLQSLGLPLLESIWQSLPWLGFSLAFVAMAGLPHAFNMIDGYNGLAGIVAVLVSCALAYVALVFGRQDGYGNAAGPGRGYSWLFVLELPAEAYFCRGRGEHICGAPWLRLAVSCWCNAIRLFRRGFRCCF